MHLLHLDSSILGADSVSRQLSAAVVARLRGSDTTVTTRDLAATPLQHLSSAHLAAAAGVPADAALTADIAAGQAALAEFLAADTVVIGMPLYNFTVPSQLKAWIDRVLIAGQTFRYTATGPEGMAGGKRVIVAVASGGVYAAGTPQGAAEHGASLLHTVFGFMGIPHIETIVADGLKVSPEAREVSIAQAHAVIAGLPLA